MIRSCFRFILQNPKQHLQHKDTRYLHCKSSQIHSQYVSHFRRKPTQLSLKNFERGSFILKARCFNRICHFSVVYSTHTWLSDTKVSPDVKVAHKERIITTNQTNKHTDYKHVYGYFISVILHPTNKG